MAAVRQVIKNTFYVFTSEALNKVINIVFIVYSARLLGAKYYGIFVLVSTMVLISSTFTNFGIRAMVVRKMSKDTKNASTILGNILGIRFCLSLAVYALLVALVNFNDGFAEVRHLVHIAGLIIIVNIFRDSFETVYIAYERMDIRGLLLVGSSFLFTAGAVAVLSLGFRLKAVFIVNLVVGLIFAVLSGVIIWKKFFPFRLRMDSPVVNDIMKQSLLFFAALLLNVLNTKIDIIMLSTVKGPIEGDLAIGYYAPAHNILMALMMLPRSLNKAMLPGISRNIYTNQDFVRKSVEKATKFVMIAISFPIIIATTFFSREIVSVIFGPGYASTAPALAILGWAYAFYAMNIPTHSVLGSTKELRDFLPLLVMILVTNVVLNLVLIPGYGYIGASVATCIVLVLGFVGRFYFLRKILEINVSELKVYLRLMFVLAATLTTVYLLSLSLYGLILVPLALAAYMFYLYFFSVFDREELDLISEWAGRLAKRGV